MSPSDRAVASLRGLDSLAERGTSALAWAGTRWEAPVSDFDSEGLHKSNEHTISTWFGLRVNPQAMKPSDILVTDIAHALARQCRYNGHTFGHLSVARHCIWVADRLAEVAPEHELWGLLHDAGEAYLGDMVRPVKHSPAMTPFREAEERLDEVIALRFGLPWPQPPEVKQADSWVCVNRELDDARHTWVGNAHVDEIAYRTRFYALTGGLEFAR